MPNDAHKADQIAYRFYSKLTLVLNNARTTADPKPLSKIDKWFNLETPESELFKDHLRIYRSISSSSPSPPPLTLHVLLCVPELSNNQVLVYLSADSPSRTRIDPTPRYILLETWLLQFSPNSPASSTTSSQHEPPSFPDVAPSTIYKHGIPLFRSLYTLLRILPTWKIFKRLRRKVGGNRNGNFSIQLSLQTGEDVLRFDVPPAANTPPFPTSTHTFPPIPHPMGTLTLSGKYLSTPNFQLDELESLLSSRFLSLDEGPDFTPTLSKNHQQTGSPGSLPIRIALPRTPPPQQQMASVADRFVLPLRSVASTTSFSGSSPSSRNMPLPSMSRNLSTGGGVGGESSSGYSVASSASKQDFTSAWSKEDVKPIAERWRKESISAGRGADLPSAPFPSPLPIRRPNINPVHPFKSSTLSSGSPSLHSPSPSLRQSSPLSSVPPSSRPAPGPNSPVGTTSTTISSMTATGSMRPPPSPIGVNRPSPPSFTPSSLGDRRSLASAEGDASNPALADQSNPSPKPMGRKRYSSSFGHRYTATGGAGSDGSAGSRERRESERREGTSGGEKDRLSVVGGSASMWSTNTDDDDISIFVQEIDARKPLSGRGRGWEVDRGSEGCEERRKDTDEAIEGRGIRGTSASGGSGPMLTSEEEVDERLRKMNEAFLASLQGLGEGSKRRGRGRGPSEGSDISGRESPAGGSQGHSQANRKGSGRVLTGGSTSGSGASGSGSGSELVIGGRHGGLRIETELVGVGSSEEVIGRMDLDVDEVQRKLER